MLSYDPASFDGLLDHIRRFCQANYPEDATRIITFTISFASGATVGAPIPPPRQRRSHSPDFRSVCWYGADYRFTPTQASCIKVLWLALEEGDPEVAGETLLETAGSECGRFAPLFQGHSAWGKMIVPGATKGTYKLAVPADD